MMNGMKKLSSAFGLIVLCGLFLSLPVFADTSRFKQWIAPLECTQSQVNNGASETIILTPEQCDDFLHPKPLPGPDDSHHPIPETPGAPDTGFFQDPVVGFVQFFLWLAGFIILLAYARRRDDTLSK